MDSVEKRCQFGNRILNDESKIFTQNAWDNVIWSKETEEGIKDKVNKNSESKLSLDVKTKHVSSADNYWDEFYKKHDKKFFKDRHWLTTEFPELINDCVTSKLRVFEIGCGVGNTIFPLLKQNKSKSIYVYGCDFSANAIQILKTHELYDEDKHCFAFVADLTNPDNEYPIKEASLDYITMIFVLSAVSPDRMKAIITRLTRYLKPGGQFLFRDYGKFDMAQMRFKPGHCLDDNFYLRGDGTLVYFFTEEELEIIVFADLEKVQLYTDKRLIVNRARQTKMYRVWLTAKFRKPYL